MIDVQALSRADRHSNGSFKVDIATDGAISHVVTAKKNRNQAKSMPSLLGAPGFKLYSKIAPCHLSETMGIIIIESS